MRSSSLDLSFVQIGSACIILAGAPACAGMRAKPVAVLYGDGGALLMMSVFMRLCQELKTT
jgi:hypothetical protein